MPALVRGEWLNKTFAFARLLATWTQHICLTQEVVDSSGTAGDNLFVIAKLQHTFQLVRRQLAKRDLLPEAWDAGARDSTVAAGLARIASEIGWTEKAQEWSAIALQLDADPTEDRVTALRIHSEIDFSQGRYSRALAGFEELTRTRREARHWFYRGMTEQNLDQTEAAIRSLRMSLEIDPRNPGAHTVLAAILASRRDPAAEQHRQAARKLLPGITSQP